MSGMYGKHEDCFFNYNVIYLLIPSSLKAKLEQAEEWLQECERSVGRIWDELQTEINSFRKSLQRVRHQYECVDNFFRHVRKVSYQ